MGVFLGGELDVVDPKPEGWPTGRKREFNGRIGPSF